jgi:hypothetical protein
MTVRVGVLTICSILAAVSLLLAVASCVTRSEFVIGAPTRLPVVIFELGSGGRLSYWYITTAEHRVIKPRTEMYTWGPLGGQRVVAPLMRYFKGEHCFVMQSTSGTSERPGWSQAEVIRNGRATLVVIHLWACLAVFSIYPLCFFGSRVSRRILQSRRSREGLCLKCGYNLTGNVSGICPECGEQI